MTPAQTSAADMAGEPEPAAQASLAHQSPRDRAIDRRLKIIASLGIVSGTLLAATSAERLLSVKTDIQQLYIGSISDFDRRLIVASLGLIAGVQLVVTSFVMG